MKPNQLPQSIEAEYGIVSSIWQGGDAVIADVIDRIGVSPGDWFVDATCAKLYQMLCNDWQHERSLDLRLVTQRLSDAKQLSDVGGASKITEIYGFLPSAAAYQHYLEVLGEKRWRRFVYMSATEIARQAMDQQDDVDVVLREAESVLAQITARHRNSTRRRDVKGIVHDVIANLGARDRILGISTGFSVLDEAVGGLAEGAKIVIAGEISSGKSSLAEAIALSLAVDRQVPTAFFSFEMSENQTVARMIQIRSEVSTWRVARGFAELLETKRYTRAAGEVAGGKLHVINERLNMAGIRSRIMQLRPRVAIIDYLQIVPELKQRGDTNTDRLDRMSVETKQLATQFNMTIIELSQLTETDKGPRTRGSRGITADSDQLWIIEGGDDAQKKVIDKTLVIAKNRDGERGAEIEFTFEKPITKFRQKN